MSEDDDYDDNPPACYQTAGWMFMVFVAFIAGCVSHQQGFDDARKLVEVVKK